MSLIRRVHEKSNDLAGRINVTSIGHYGVWWIDHLSNSVVHHIGMEGSHVRKDYADDQPAVPRYSIVHAPKHGELLVVSVLQHKTVHRRRGIETQIVETTYDFAPGTDLYGQRVVGPGELDGGKGAVRIPEEAPRKDPRRIHRFRNRNRVEAHDLTFLVDSLRLGAAADDDIWSINRRVGTVAQQIAVANTSHGVTANDIALRIDPQSGGQGNTGQSNVNGLEVQTAFRSGAGRAEWYGQAQNQQRCRHCKRGYSQLSHLFSSFSSRDARTADRFANMAFIHKPPFPSGLCNQGGDRSIRGALVLGESGSR